MEFRQLKYFLAVADRGSISKAATQMFVAQSALSTQICQLEEELGACLLYRSSRGVTLTEIGRAFYEHSQAIMRQIGDAHAVVTQKLSDSPTGTITLGMPHTVSPALAWPLLLAARDRLPKVRLDIAEDSPDNLIDQIKQERIHLAIVFDEGHLADFSTQWIAEEQMYFLYMPKDAAASHTESIELRDALQLPLVLPGKRHEIRQCIEKAATTNRLAVNSVMDGLDSFCMLKDAVLAGTGATISPLAPFHRELQQGLMRAKKIHAADMSRAVTVCASQRASRTQAGCAVSRLIVRVAHELCGAGKWPGAVPAFDDTSSALTGTNSLARLYPFKPHSKANR